VRKEILSLQADPRSPERGQYFLQDLLGRSHETMRGQRRAAPRRRSALRRPARLERSSPNRRLRRDRAQLDPDAEGAGRSAPRPA
jgi:hypothetical protein